MGCSANTLCIFNYAFIGSIFFWYFIDLSLLFMWREQEMNINLKPLDSWSTLSSKKPFILLWITILYFRQVHQFIVYAYYHKLFFFFSQKKDKNAQGLFLASSGESRTKFESQAPLLLDIMIYSTVKRCCKESSVDWGRRKKLCYTTSPRVF